MYVLNLIFPCQGNIMLSYLYTMLDKIAVY